MKSICLYRGTKGAKVHPLTFLVMSTEGHIILGKVEGERWETNIKRAIFYTNKVQKRAILRENSPMLPHFFQVCL